MVQLILAIQAAQREQATRALQQEMDTAVWLSLIHISNPVNYPPVLIANHLFLLFSFIFDRTFQHSAQICIKDDWL